MNDASPLDSEPGPLVRLIDVHRQFGRTAVLRGLSADFERGRTTVVLGPSGCGKSVMLKHIVGLLRPDSGEVWFDDQRVDQLSERKLTPIRQRIGFLFQNGALFDSLSVRENVEFPLLEHSALSREQRMERVRHVVNLVGLIDLLDRMPAQLSGGQRKRIALARAIVLSPDLVLYDEPTTGLDPIRSDVINELILRLKRELGAAAIVVTHDLVSAFKVADEMIMLDEGRVRFRGSPQAMRTTTDPVVRRFLLGEASPEDLPPVHSGAHT